MQLFCRNVLKKTTWSLIFKSEFDNLCIAKGEVPKAAENPVSQRDPHPTVRGLLGALGLHHIRLDAHRPLRAHLVRRRVPSASSRVRQQPDTRRAQSAHRSQLDSSRVRSTAATTTITATFHHHAVVTNLSSRLRVPKRPQREAHWDDSRTVAIHLSLRDVWYDSRLLYRAAYHLSASFGSQEQRE